MFLTIFEKGWFYEIQKYHELSGVILSQKKIMYKSHDLWRNGRVTDREVSQNVYGSSSNKKFYGSLLR